MSRELKRAVVAKAKDIQTTPPAKTVTTEQAMAAIRAGNAARNQ
jgi:hypothetical protein